MDRQVFHYRTGGAYGVIGFLLFCGGLCIASALFCWNNPEARVNDMPGTSPEARTILSGAIAVGLVVLAGAAALIVTSKNSRIEVGNGEIVWFDWLGREKVRGVVRGAKLQKGENPSDNNIQLITNGGIINAYDALDDLGRLNALLRRENGEVDAPRATSYIPSERTFSYRWTYLHFFSLVWCIGAGIYMPLLALVGLPFLGIGVWLQLTGWRERISLGPDGITWIDFLGRTRVQARLDQIREVIRSKDDEGYSSLRVVTDEGTVQAASYLKGFNALHKEAKRVVEEG